MKKITASAILLIMMVFSSQSALAQFQGQIQMNLYSNDKNKTEVNELNMFITTERIYLKGEESVNVSNGIDANGFLVRNDMKDFIVLMGNNRALQVTKEEIEGLFNMFSMMGDDDPKVNANNAAEPINYRYTDKTRNILGYECTQMIIEDNDDGDYVSIWLTPNIDINWGMLAQPWKNLPKDMEMSVNRMSQDAIFTGKNFPLLVEAYDGKTELMKPVMEVTSINESNIAKAMVQVPSGVNLVGISELMWKLMMEK